MRRTLVVRFCVCRTRQRPQRIAAIPFEGGARASHAAGTIERLIELTVKLATEDRGDRRRDRLRLRDRQSAGLRAFAASGAVELTGIGPETPEKPNRAVLDFLIF
jgi:hypothetical protein